MDNGGSNPGMPPAKDSDDLTSTEVAVVGQDAFLVALARRASDLPDAEVLSRLPSRLDGFRCSLGFGRRLPPNGRQPHRSQL